MLPQEQRSKNYKNLQPKNIEKNSVQLIMAYDLAGWQQQKIAEQMQMTQSRVSIIMNSPLYKSARNRRFAELQGAVIEKKSTEVADGDIVQKRIKELAVDAINTKEELLHGSKQDFVRNAVATDLLDRAGYYAEGKKTKLSIEVTDKMADRFAKILNRDEATTKIKLELENG